MLTTIKGYYENGQIILKEPAPVNEKTEVMVTFLNEKKKKFIVKNEYREG